MPDFMKTTIEPRTVIELDPENDKDMAALASRLTDAMIETLDWIHETGVGDRPDFATDGIMQALSEFQLISITSSEEEPKILRYSLTPIGRKVGLSGSDDFYPEHGKLREVQDEIDAVREFVEVAERHHDIFMARWRGEEGSHQWIEQIDNQTFEDILMAVFKIDPMVIEEERRKMIDAYKEN